MEFGQIFLLLAAEVARREAPQDELWPYVYQRLPSEWVFSAGPHPYPQSPLRELIKEVVRDLELRHCFDTHERDMMIYRDTVMLQVGFTLRGFCERGSAWLGSDEICTVTVKALRFHHRNRSERFVETWQVLQEARRGRITPDAALTRLAGGPWLLPAHLDAYIDAATEGTGAARVRSNWECHSRLKTAGYRAGFVLSVRHLDRLGTAAPTVIVRADGAPDPAQIYRQADGTYPAQDIWVTPRGPLVGLSLWTQNADGQAGQQIDEREISLWSEDSDVAVFGLRGDIHPPLLGMGYILAPAWARLAPIAEAKWPLGSRWVVHNVNLSDLDLTVYGEDDEIIWQRTEDTGTVGLGDAFPTDLAASPADSRIGDDVSVSVQLPSGMTMVGCRFAGMPVPWQVTGSQVAVGPVALAPELTPCQMNLDFTVECGGTRARVRRNLIRSSDAVIGGAAIRTKDGWQAISAEGCVTLSQASRCLWRLGPKYALTESAVGWMLTEGAHELGPAIASASLLPGASALRCLGEPLTAKKLTAYPHRDTIVAGIVRQGAVIAASADMASMTIDVCFDMPVDPTPDHRVLVWGQHGEVRDYFGEEILADAETRTWTVATDSECGVPLAVALVFENMCRGAIRVGVLDESIVTDGTARWGMPVSEAITEVLRLARWMRLPVLGRALLPGFTSLARISPESVVDAWCYRCRGRGLPCNLEWPEDGETEIWQTAARSVLLRARIAGTGALTWDLGKLRPLVGLVTRYSPEMWWHAADVLASVDPWALVTLVNAEPEYRRDCCLLLRNRLTQSGGIADVPHWLAAGAPEAWIGLPPEQVESLHVRMEDGQFRNTVALKLLGLA